MSVRFKFRSSVNFESIPIQHNNTARSITVAELRSKIIHKLGLKLCEGFRLVIADFTDEKVFEDDDFPIESGSSVIIKRVPTEATSIVPSLLPRIDAGDNLEKKRSDMARSFEAFPSEENFDDFGIDLCPAVGESLFDSAPDINKMNDNSMNKACHEVPSNLEPSDLSEADEEGNMHFEFEEDTPQTKLEQRKEAYKDAVLEKDPVLPKTDLPSELRCSLCNMIFKDPVLIPCCQHSFCEKCILVVLVEKQRCPKCTSPKCGTKDLLPNVSLRQAIEHFLESELLISGSDNVIPKYPPAENIPDGESGIHMKEFSNAVSVCPRDLLLPHSSSVTGKGSNQVMTNLKSSSKKSKPASEFQGESRPVKLPPTAPKGEASSTTQNKKELWVNYTDGPGYFTGNRKADRTCFMCGSPDHFIRDCPAATNSYPNPYPMVQPGDPMYPSGMPSYTPPYWQGPSLAHMMPYSNMYAAPGMMPYDPSMVPVPSYRVPYMPSIYPGMSVPCGVMGMGGLISPMGIEVERPVSRAELMELQESEQRYKFLAAQQHSEHLREPYEDYSHYEPQRSHDRRAQIVQEKRASISEDTDNRRLHRKRSRDRRSDDHGYEKSFRSSHHYDVTGSEIQTASDSSNHYTKEKHRHHSKSSKKHSDSSSKRSSHHQNQKEVISDRKKIDIDIKKHSRRYHDGSDSGLEPNSSGDRKRHRKEKHSSQNSKHRSKHNVKPIEDDSGHDRWQMGDSSEESRDHHKCKRVH